MRRRPPSARRSSPEERPGPGPRVCRRKPGRQLLTLADRPGLPHGHRSRADRRTPHPRPDGLLLLLTRVHERFPPRLLTDIDLRAPPRRLRHGPSRAPSAGRKVRRAVTGRLFSAASISARLLTFAVAKGWPAVQGAPALRDPQVAPARRRGVPVRKVSRAAKPRPRPRPPLPVAAAELQPLRPSTLRRRLAALNGPAVEPPERGGETASRRRNSQAERPPS